MLNRIKELLKEESLENTLKERDKHKIDSTDWNILNDLKAFMMESKKPSTSENILTYKEEDLENIEEGFRLNLDIDKVKTFEQRRSKIEYHPLYRHPIPYIIVRNKDKFFFILREKGSGEARLIGLKGMLGGHVAAEDGSILDSLHREIYEEAGITKEMITNLDFLGTLKSNEGVDADHLGLIFLININTDEIKSEEEGILTGMWIDKEDLKEHEGQFESWSKIIYRDYLKNI